MPRLLFEPRHRLWLLSTPSTSYAIRLDEQDDVRHVHWGAALTLAQAAEIAGRPAPPGSSFDTVGGPEELAAEGGARFGPAGFQVRFADGTKGVEWRYAGHEAEDGHLRIHLNDRHYPLRLTGPCGFDELTGVLDPVLGRFGTERFVITCFGTVNANADREPPFAGRLYAVLIAPDHTRLDALDSAVRSALSAHFPEENS